MSVKKNTTEIKMLNSTFFKVVPKTNNVAHFIVIVVYMALLLD